MVNDPIEPLPKATAQGNLQGTRDETKSTNLLDKKRVEKQNEKGVVAVNLLEEPCEMTGVEATEHQNECSEANQAILDPRIVNIAAKIFETSNDLAFQINSLDQFFSEQVKALQQAKKSTT